MGNKELVVCLVEEFGADVCKTIENGWTPLMIACVEMHVNLKIVRYLLKNGVHVNKATDDGCTALYIAAQMGNKELVVCLVEEFGADVNQTGKNGSTPLMIASAGKHVKIVPSDTY
jgi:ankyrin repeat protein